MAKKKRRKKKYRKAPSNCARSNNHHLLWERARWVKHPWACSLRSHPACIVTMDAQQHARLHERISHIPVASEDACELAYNEVNKLWNDGVLTSDTSVDVRISLLICIFEYIAQPTADALKEQITLIREIRGG